MYERSRAEMAHPQGGHRLPTQHNQNLPTRSHPSAPLSGPNTRVRQTPSFDLGDDLASLGPVNGVSGQRKGYRPGSIAGNQHEELYLGSQSSALPLRLTSQGGGDGYQHQESPSEARTHPSYNPQQYGAPQLQYSPQISNTFGPITHQPYVPAAYRSSGNAYLSTYTGPSQGTPPQALPSMFMPHTSPETPPPPPRPHEHRPSNPVPSRTGTDSRANYPNASPEPPYQEKTLLTAPYPQPSSVVSSYTPPAPPPPPFSPSQDAYPSNSTASFPSFSQRSVNGSLQHRLPARPPSLHNSLPLLPFQANTSPRVPSPIIHRRPVGLNSPLPPTPSIPSIPGTPGPTPPAHSPQRRDTAGRHPQARPLPGPPTTSTPELDYFGGSNGHNSGQDTTPGYDDLMQEVEAAVLGRPLSSISRQGPGTEPTSYQRPVEDDHASQPSPNSTLQRGFSSVGARSHIHTNDSIEEICEGQYISYDAYSDRGDAEAEAGLAAMRMADEQDALDAARTHNRTSLGEVHQPRHPSRSEERSEETNSDSDVYIDMETYGGDISGLHYGDRESSLLPENHGHGNEVDEHERRFTETRSSGRSDMSSGRSGTQSGLYDYPIPGESHIHPFAPARVDRAGTGGFSEPGAQPRRLSFEDGDEATLAESENAYSSMTQSPSRDSLPDMFFHPGVGTSRPLPPAPTEMSRSVSQLMPAGTHQHPERLLQYDQYGHPTFPSAPDAYNQLLTPHQGSVVPRSSSLISHSSSPQTVPPIRSKTDADRAKILKQQQMSLRAGSFYGTDSFGDPSLNPSAELLNLPEIPSGKRRKFHPSKLSTADFKKCTEPWALSSILAWVKEVSDGEADLKRNALFDAIVALFTHKVPTMNTADAELLGNKVINSMLESNTLLKEEEWVKFGTADMTGVLYQLTGTGCYSPRVHAQATPGRCYAHQCMRTLKKINLQTQVLEPQRKVEDWVTFYKLTKSQIEKVGKKEVERQNNLHEIVTTEDSYMDQLYVLQVLYRDELAKWQPPIIAPKRKDSFLRDVFGKVDAIKQVNEDYLLAQLKYRQQEKGPWIDGFSDIFREWIRKASGSYIEYAACFPNASSLIRQEAERNILFRQFLDQVRDNERSKRLGWDTYLKAPITRLQRYSLLLSTVLGHTVQESEEKANLIKAISEIKNVTLECDAKVADNTKNVALAELQAKLVLRPEMADVKLNLTHLGRELIHEGEVQRVGKNKFSWVETHAILFDHYMVLAKVLAVRDAAGGLKYEKYDVSKQPIPMELLVLESANDDPVVKSTMKGIGAVATATKAPTETRASRQSISNPTGGPGTLAHTNTASSVASVLTNGSAKTLVTTTVVDNSKDENLLWPFRVKHLGPNKIYTLYSPSSKDRQEWCAMIIEAKTRHASSLHKQNAEPFRLRVIADTAFANDPMASSGKTVIIKGTPLDRAIQEVEEQYKDAGPRPTPVCRAAVNCATAFDQPHGNAMVAVGTDYGVFVSNANNPRGWSRVWFSPFV